MTTIELPRIAYRRFLLPNGLTLIVHENHELPQVAVHLTYRVGSRDEPPGLHGFAHLFEHLLFSGSDNLPGNYLTHLQGVGANPLNGTTSPDMTQYFECVPLGALDFALFAESDRMGAFAGSLNQAALDTQLEVVVNEMREAQLAPYGRVHAKVLETLFSTAHPYAHGVLGSEEDLRSAKLADAQAWFARHYRPNNAVLTLAGDITADRAREKVEAWFGDIPPGEPVDRLGAWLPPRAPQRRVTLHEWGARPLLRMAWLLPPYGTPATTAMQLLAEHLAGGGISQLRRTLILDRGIASEVSAYVETGSLASYFNISVILSSGHTLAEAEACVRQELAELRRHGPDEEALQRARQTLLTTVLDGQVSNADIAALLGTSDVQLGSPDAHRTVLEQLLAIDAPQLGAVLQDWIGDQGLVLQVLHPTLSWTPPAAPRVRQRPMIEHLPPRSLPPIQHWQLENGLQVSLVERPGQAVISASLLVEAGACHEPPTQAGLAQLVCGLLAAGAGERDAVAFMNEMGQLGVTLESLSNWTSVVLRVRLLGSVLDAGLDLLAEAVISPRLQEDVFERLKQATLELAERRSGALAVLPGLLFPATHPYAKAYFTEGSVASLEHLQANDAKAFHRRHYRPGNTRLLVIGDLSREGLQRSLAGGFCQWRDAAAAGPTATASALVAPSMGQVALIERHAAPNATISVLFSLPALDHGENAEAQLLHKLLADGFASRMNLSLRERHRLTYGVSGLFIAPQGYCFIGFELSVAGANLLRGVREIVGELNAIVTDHPFSADELENVRRGELLQMAMLGDSPGAFTAHYEQRLLSGHSEDDWQRLVSAVECLDLDSLNAFAVRHLRLANSAWYLEGDTAPVERDLQACLALEMCHPLEDCADPHE